ncbi:MAG: ParB/RepB/Spo0J family partition protein, partial [Actinomycetota bacterium]|nr:ParB/RepB/Spo0J family partition protein [Actinomycetota bacterium]
MTKRSESLAAEPVGIKTLRTDQLQPNPFNPRMLFDKAPMKTLQESIERVGILVPLTVYQRGSDGKFIILDGQRRWICAQELGVTIVPVNQVAEPSTVQNIVTMFQIHKLREDWELMPTALKLDVLMQELKETSERKLAELTGLDIAVVTRCKKLLSYPKEYQELMLDPDPDKRVKADFFIELYPVLHDRAVTKLPGYSRASLTKKMLGKYQDPAGGIRAVTDFRKVKQHIANANRAGKLPTLLKKLGEFIEEVELAPDHLIIPAASVAAQARSLYGKVQQIDETLASLDVEEYLGEEELWGGLESLLRTIRRCLAAAGRRVKE